MESMDWKDIKKFGHTIETSGLLTHELCEHYSTTQWMTRLNDLVFTGREFASKLTVRKARVTKRVIRVSQKVDDRRNRSETDSENELLLIIANIESSDRTDIQTFSQTIDNNPGLITLELREYYSDSKWMPRFRDLVYTGRKLTPKLTVQKARKIKSNKYGDVYPMTRRVRGVALDPMPTDCPMCSVNSDGQVVPVDTILGYFNNDNCRVLYNKPKMFFVSACRGHKPDLGVLRPLGRSPGESSVRGLYATGGSIPTWSDMFVYYSTIEGITQDMTAGYSNWVEGSPQEEWYSRSCVQISISSYNYGKWFDEPCSRRALVVCERRQEWTIHTLSTALENVTNLLSRQQEVNARQWEVIEELRQNMTYIISQSIDTNISKVANDRDLQSTGIPIGFIYIQLPNQSEPINLWPQTNWSDVTQLYSGLFFRAEGAGSLPFGQTQQANYSSIIATSVTLSDGVDVTDERMYAIREGQWSGTSVTTFMEIMALNSIRVFKTRGENRPVNTAVRIWKLVGSSHNIRLGFRRAVNSTAMASRLRSPPLHDSTLVSIVSAIIRSDITVRTFIS
ncbi:unnamed protein product [Oppiella nova]|uniref:C-type lectin domain-containing protein n=1 Tax=Oppiella nova TaxID=334625 RepID=A0A7R9MBW7_9ACAR|nr:unnamed protein product [Oppiella nova]CAG2174544.1 unnamed protein product [Oppiella nova]